MSATTTEIQTRPILRFPDELLASTVFLLGRMGMTVKGRALAEFEGAGFDGYHYSVLALLAEGARETQATIAAALGLDSSQLVGLLDSLEERRLIERHRDPRDRRRHVVSLTPAGKKQLVRLRSIAKRLDAEFFAPLDPESKAALHGLLLRLASYHDPRCGPGEAATLPETA